MTTRPPDNRPLPAPTLAHGRVTEASERPNVFHVPTAWPVDDFAAYLLALMREARISDYAELSRISGVNQTQFSNWRQGKSQPSRESLNKVARALGVPPVSLWLMAGLADEQELDMAERPDLTVLPREFTELLELWRDEKLTEQQRELVRSSVAVLVGGLRAQLGERGRGRPNVRRKAG